MVNKGLVHVYTGDGKGKTTAALGLAIRATGQGKRVIIIQFLKGDPNCGEHIFASQCRSFEVVQFTKGNCFVLPEDQLKSDVDQAMEYAFKVLTGGEYDMVILDEIFIAVRRGLLETSAVIELIDRKPDTVEFVLTGRGAPQEIIDMADYVTSMQMIKHPYVQGVKSRKGIEF